MRASKVTAGHIEAKHVEAMFFAAMRKGWAFGFKATDVEDSPGVKRLEYRDGHWFVRDEYSTTIGTRSGGIGRIWFRNILVWEMHYWGEYEEKAIPILKAILRETYAACQFCGGRGNDDLPASEGLLYENVHRGGFKSFSGRERVIDVAHQGRQLGYHAYSGGLMVDLPLPDSKADMTIFG